ncbi:molybdenum cofactor cytidylyltransferase [Inhella inkyongensis]|uniref:Molybdenum cofactor cytidylyltransferase n=1 Tax=Inhella inkyongensis TaxID=392593 RepID=A0A840S426_9BURK|nr:nucleotidyltransferase family protein [Inhella inkyongensis]MBB5204208.1 molybdenum cofactor cytidylyltransferase [Inhella inkyongensis]
MNTGLPVVIVLAAGRGSRFEGPGHKLQQPLGASTVLGRTLDHALASQMRVLVVCTEALAPLIRSKVAARDMVVLPPAPRGAEGMGLSISAGVSAAASAPGWLILPGDMPQISPTTLRAVAARLMSDPVVFAQYKGRRGHPVGFGAEMYSELIALQGDEGARRLLARYAAQAVEVDDPGVLQDVDTAADLRRMQEAEPESTPKRRQISP